MSGKRILGLVLSARAGNCLDFARKVLPEEDVLWLGGLRLGPCAGCDYECFRERDCPIDDDLRRVHERLRAADGWMVFCPVYDERPPGLFYALGERLPSAWRRTAEGFAGFEGKPVAIVVVGNRGTKRTLDVLQEFFRQYRMEVAGTATIYPNLQPRGGGIAGGLVENESAVAELLALRRVLS